MEWLVLDGQLLVLVIFLLFGACIGVVSSMLGIGGGTLLVPLLVVMFLFTPRSASAVSLMAAVFVSLSSTVSYSRQRPRPILYGTGLMLMSVTVPGSMAGAWLGTYLQGIDENILRHVFAAVLFPIALKMAFSVSRGKAEDVKTELEEFRAHGTTRGAVMATLIGAFTAGVLSGLLGIGGGVVIVPLLTLVMRVPMHTAVATSMFTMVFTTLSGTVTNVLLGEISMVPVGDLALGTAIYGTAVGAGMLLGAPVGCKLACRVGSSRLKSAFGILLIYPVLRMARLGDVITGSVSYVASTLAELGLWALVAVLTLIVRARLVRSKRQTAGDASDAECKTSQSF
ncbi:MAG: sulfite exporter TauE/SafE family protein [Candidatus Thorarchaeota archaeon]